MSSHTFDLPCPCVSIPLSPDPKNEITVFLHFIDYIMCSHDNGHNLLQIRHEMLLINMLNVLAKRIQKYLDLF